MKELGKRRLYPEQFKKEAVLLVTERGYSIVQAAQVVDTSEKNLQRWVKQQAQEKNGERLDTDERAELNHLRREIKTLRMEREILKKALGDSIGHCNTAEIFCDGDKKFNVFLGRSFNSSAIISSCSCE